jgi:hypothetical protein
MSWREWFGLEPRIEDFAAKLIRRAGRAAVWTYDREQQMLLNSSGAQINLRNIFLEYSHAPRAGRRGLLDKYAAMLTASSREVPKLWTLAAKAVMPAVRSKYDYMAIEIKARGDSKPPMSGVTWPLAGDLHIRLLYDFGENMTHVTPELCETWGQTQGALREQAMSNLKALPRPIWTPLEKGVYRVASEVAYEETFFLIDAVVDQLPFAESAVVMPVNRGVLLAADGRSEAQLGEMLLEAFASLQENPWPISGVMLTRRERRWQEFQGEGLVARRAKAVATLNLAGTYKDQQDALTEWLTEQGEDVFVATFDLRQRGDDIGDIFSWCVWIEGLPTLLPQTDVIIFGKGEEPNRESLRVNWSDAVTLCGHYMEQTTDDPPRYRLKGFPNAVEWQRLLKVGEAI